MVSGHVRPSHRAAGRDILCPNIRGRRADYRYLPSSYSYLRQNAGGV